MVTGGPSVRTAPMQGSFDFTSFLAKPKFRARLFLYKTLC
jgi:hypothetical protein